MTGRITHINYKLKELELENVDESFIVYGFHAESITGKKARIEVEARFDDGEFNGVITETQFCMVNREYKLTSEVEVPGGENYDYIKALATLDYREETGVSIIKVDTEEDRTARVKLMECIAVDYQAMGQNDFNNLDEILDWYVDKSNDTIAQIHEEYLGAEEEPTELEEAMNELKAFQEHEDEQTRRQTKQRETISKEQTLLWETFFDDMIKIQEQLGDIHFVFNTEYNIPGSMKCETVGLRVVDSRERKTISVHSIAYDEEGVGHVETYAIRLDRQFPFKAHNEMFRNYMEYIDDIVKGWQSTYKEKVEGDAVQKIREHISNNKKALRAEQDRIDQEQESMK